MIINLQTYKSDLKSRVDYLLYGVENSRPPEKVDTLYGDADLFLELSKLNPYKRKSYNYLISFAESKEELEKKLKEKGKTIEELFDEILDYLIYPYKKEDLNIFAVGHSDTDNYHIHLTIENKHYVLDRSLRIPLTELEVKLFLLLSEYFKEKYDLEFHYKPISQGPVLNKKKKKILELKGVLKCKERDEFKEELTNHLLNLIFEGVITSREELINYLKNDLGFKIKRKGKNYITIAVDGFRVRLKGGIYDEEHFRKVFEEIERDRKRIRENKEKLLRELEERLRRIQERRAELIRKYYRKSLKRNKEIFRKNFTEGTFENKSRDKNFKQDLNFDANDFIPNDRLRNRLLHNKNISISLSCGSDKWREILSSSGNNLQVGRGKGGIRNGEGRIFNSPKNPAERKLLMIYEIKKLLKLLEEKEKQLIFLLPPKKIMKFLGISKNEIDSIYFDEKKVMWIYKIGNYRGDIISIYGYLKNLSYDEAFEYIRKKIGCDEILKNLTINGNNLEELFQILEVYDLTIEKLIKKIKKREIIFEKKKRNSEGIRKKKK